jgi:hypothetical protein
MIYDSSAKVYDLTAIGNGSCISLESQSRPRCWVAYLNGHQIGLAYIGQAFAFGD